MDLVAPAEPGPPLPPPLLPEPGVNKEVQNILKVKCDVKRCPQMVLRNPAKFEAQAQSGLYIIYNSIQSQVGNE